MLRVLFDNDQLGVLLAEVQLDSVEDDHQDEGKRVEVYSVPKRLTQFSGRSVSYRGQNISNQLPK